MPKQSNVRQNLQNHHWFRFVLAIYHQARGLPFFKWVHRYYQSPLLVFIFCLKELIGCLLLGITTVVYVLAVKAEDVKVVLGAFSSFPTDCSFIAFCSFFFLSSSKWCWGSNPGLGKRALNQAASLVHGFVFLGILRMTLLDETQHFQAVAFPHLSRCRQRALTSCPHLDASHCQAHVHPYRRGGKVVLVCLKAV